MLRYRDNGDGGSTVTESPDVAFETFGSLGGRRMHLRAQGDGYTLWTPKVPHPATGCFTVTLPDGNKVNVRDFAILKQ